MPAAPQDCNICSCCGCEFENGEDCSSGMSYEEYRNSWVNNGAKWFSNYVSAPENWDADEQIRKAGLGD